MIMASLIREIFLFGLMIFCTLSNGMLMTTLVEPIVADFASLDHQANLFIPECWIGSIDKTLSDVSSLITIAGSPGGNFCASLDANQIEAMSFELYKCDISRSHPSSIPRNCTTAQSCFSQLTMVELGIKTQYHLFVKSLCLTLMDEFTIRRKLDTQSMFESKRVCHCSISRTTFCCCSYLTIIVFCASSVYSLFCIGQRVQIFFIQLSKKLSNNRKESSPG